MAKRKAEVVFDIDFARCYLRAPKSLDFQGPPFAMALVMDLPTSK